MFWMFKMLNWNEKKAKQKTWNIYSRLRSEYFSFFIFFFAVNSWFSSIKTRNASTEYDSSELKRKKKNKVNAKNGKLSALFEREPRPN